MDEPNEPIDLEPYSPFVRILRFGPPGYETTVGFVLNPDFDPDKPGGFDNLRHFFMCIEYKPPTGQPIDEPRRH